MQPRLNHTNHSLFTVDINNNIIDTRKESPKKCCQKATDIPENDEKRQNNEFSRTKRFKLNRAISNTSTDSVEEFCYIDNSKLLKIWEWARETRGLGLMFAFLAVICWSGNSLCYKLINDRLEPLVMFTFTSLFVALFYLAVILCFYKPSKICKSMTCSGKESKCRTCSESPILDSLSMLLGSPGERLHLVSRCVLGTISQGALYTSYKYIPMADATTIRFTSPVFIAIFAHFLVDEPFGMLQIINVIMTLIGVVLVGRPSFFFGYEVFHQFDNSTAPQNLSKNFTSTTSSAFGDIENKEQIYGLVLALVAALSISVSMISVRKLKATPAALVIFWFSISNVVLGAGTVMLMGHSFAIDWGMTVIAFFIVTSIGTTLDQLCITMALKLENAGAVAVIQALCVLFSFILSITVVGETIHITSAFGGSLIFLSVIILAGAKWYNELDAYSKFGSRASLNTTSSSDSIKKDPIDNRHYEVNLNSYVHNNQNHSSLPIKGQMDKLNGKSFPSISIEQTPTLLRVTPIDPNETLRNESISVYNCVDGNGPKTDAQDNQV